jgi:hypothetical protein
MNNSRPSLEHLGNVLADPERGVLGLVDELLMMSRDQDIRIEWQSGICHVIFFGRDLSDRIEVPLRKSVVRASFARIAALCNERSPGSVSPYGGHGEVAIDAEPLRVIRATFVNTPDLLSLELASASSEAVSLVSLSVAKSSQ